MNIDENLIEPAITEKTKAIVPMHYGGVSCEMDKINAIAKKHNLFVVEDSAQGQGAFYKGRPLGTIGDMGVLSFAETKNFSSGEGGAFITKNSDILRRAEVIREKGTDRSKFMRGEVDRYTWIDLGSSYVIADILAAYLFPQLLVEEKINADRTCSWDIYYTLLSRMQEHIELPFVPIDCKHNAHMFYIKVKDVGVRTALMEYLKESGIATAFHFVPLHSSPAGKKFGRMHGEDKWTTEESERLLRLPMYYGLKTIEIEFIAGKIQEFYEGRVSV